MEEDPFDSFDLADDESAAPRAPEEEADDVENRDERRREISMAMTQKLYGNAGMQNHGMENFEQNNYLEPRNKFEEILAKENVKIAVDEESYEKFVVFGEKLNHEEFTRNLEIRISESRDVFEEFQAACNSDTSFLTVYLTPAKSKFGLQDTIFRAFLQIRATQTKAFDLLLQKTNILARRSDEADLLLAQTCVAHLRHLNRLFEPLAVFNLLFEFPFRLWNPNVRDDLIAALPEIFTDINLQQSTAIRLNQEIMETQNIEDIPSFHLSIIETLRLLRMDSSVGRDIRISLIKISNNLDVFSLPSLVAFSLGSLLIPTAQKSEEEEANFHEILREISRNLKIESLKKKTSKADGVVFEIFSHFFRFLQLDRKSWKFMTSWVNRSKKLQKTKGSKTEEAPEEAPEGQAEDVTAKTEENSEDATEDVLNTFETLLVFSLLSASESCPAPFISAVNSRILNMSTTTSAKFLKLVDFVLQLRKFATAHLPALIHVAKQCLWSGDSAVRATGVSIWKRIFVGMEKKERLKVFTELMKHFTQSEQECEAVLDVFAKTIKSQPAVILEFSTEVQKCIELIHNLSISNIKRLFQVMLMLSAASKDKKFEIDEIINRFLISVSEREKFLGILAILMKIQVEMSKKHTENQELKIRELVEKIEEAVKSSPNLRGAFYNHMRIVVENHKRAEEIRFITEWSENLLQRFKEDFFEEKIDDEDTRMVLKPNPLRISEVVPMFSLIRELQVLKMRWKEEDSDSLTSNYDEFVIRDLNFAFEAEISTADNQNLEGFDKIDILYFQSTWTRTILNGFLAQSSLDFLKSEDVSRITTRMFYLMMDCEKKMLAELAGRKKWTVPNLKFEKKEDVVVVTSSSEKKRGGGNGGGRKRKSDETLVETMAEEANEEDEEGLDFPKELPNVAIQLKSHLVQLKLRPIVHLMKLAKTKRSCLVYLCDELQSVLDALIKMRKKTPPMLAAREPKAAGAGVDKLYHGDSVTVWFAIKKAVEQVWSIVELVFDFFSNLPEASQEPNAKLQKDLEELGQKSLQLIHTIFSGELYDEKAEKRSVLVRIVEKIMLGKESMSNDPEGARFEIAKFLVKVAEFAPNPAVAVAILDVFEDVDASSEAPEAPEGPDVRKTMAKYALAYLKKDWSKTDEIWAKGTKINQAVREILTHYIKLRRENDQLRAIQWILTNKVVQLVPEDDKRKSCVFSQQSDDDIVGNEEQKATFSCITKSTFGVVFKTIFGALNGRCLRSDMSATAVRNQTVDDVETLASWELASQCFLILCLLLRVNKIRTTAVLTTAVREGKQFLITVSKKSSFIYLMDNITKGSNFDAIYQRVERILSAVQQGNRVLQSIGNFAKTNKCVHLLKKFPELRAESENCLRIIHSAMVKNECLNAFTVGLVKSRSIDGEIITEQRESSIDTDDDE